VEWNDFTFFGSNAAESLTFQAKLFEDGRIEYHYCDMVGAGPRVSGGEASIGIEGPAGVFGMAAGINQSGAANSGSALLISTDAPAPPDAGPPVPDAGVSAPDAGTAAPDGGTPWDGGTVADGGLAPDAN
jgi:hypothetical protein